MIAWRGGVVYYLAMTLSAGVLRAGLILLAGFLLGGCLPSAPGDEEREPYFLAGKARENSMDYTGAIQSFEKAIEVNPKSALAHFELASLYDSREPDPAAAIYHYERYLKLAPKSGKEEIVRTRILACKQQLAQSVYLSPVNEKQQHDLELLAVENKRLREELENWRASYQRLQALTNQAGAVAPPTRGAQASGLVQPALSNSTNPRRPAPPVSTRTHIVKAGERPGSIARMYGIKLEALMAANPKLEARRMQVGQTLNIPPP
jgi:tetratricopeptide (TPR) repeat protein